MIPKPDFNIMFLCGDQPTTCPKCGLRTDILLDMSHTRYGTQIHLCENQSCNFLFVQVEDIENMIFINANKTSSRLIKIPYISTLI